MGIYFLLREENDLYLKVLSQYDYKVAFFCIGQKKWLKPRQRTSLFVKR